MAQNLSIALNYLAAVASGAALSSDALTVAKSGSISIQYAPFDYIAPEARLVIVGITPGRFQAEAALAALKAHTARGMQLNDALRLAKQTASFSGAMRNNLVAMLDGIGVNRLLGVTSSTSLFRPEGGDVHFTSALRYPVFVAGENYKGTPDMLRTPALRRMVETHLAEEARTLPQAVWLPLGPKVEAALLHLSSLGILDRKRVLAGMPHPSGANGERVAVFLGRKDPKLASKQTNPVPLLRAFAELRAQIGAMAGAAA